MPEEEQEAEAEQPIANVDLSNIDKQPTPRGCVIFMWVTGIFALALFLVPACYVIKFYAVDNGPEMARAQGLDLSAKSSAQKSAEIDDTDATNMPLLVRDLQLDPDAVWRAKAAASLGVALNRRGVNYTHPMECLSAKAALSTAAVSDKDPAVRKAASDAIQVVAEHGAVIER